MVPNTPFFIRVSRKAGAKRWQQDMSFMTLLSAMAAYQAWTKRPDVTGVSLMMILEETQKEDLSYVQQRDR